MVVSLLDTYRQDAEWIHEIPVKRHVYRDVTDILTISITKLGGGTVGEEYHGDWICQLSVNGELAVSEILHAGMVHDHRSAYGEFCGFLSAWSDPHSGASTYMPELAPYTDTFTMEEEEWASR